MIFDCDKNKLGVDYAHSDWSENRAFAYDLVAELKPEEIFELGVYLGCSLFTFAQSVKDNCLHTNITGIDTFQGDQHMAKGYNKSAYDIVMKTKKRFYNDIYIGIVSTPFDDHLQFVADDFIDLLHIDGQHTYEAVKHDYEAWLPKLKQDGIILFHDIYVKKEGFGVNKFWNEIKQTIPAVEIKGVNGLGVLMPKGDGNKDIIYKAITR